MVAMTLTNDLIEGGRVLVEKLDESNSKVNAALWFLSPDQNIWKLLISLDGIGAAGPKSAYMRIQKALSKIDDPHGLSLDDVALIKPDNFLLKLLKGTLRIGPNLQGIRFTNNVINGHLIPDAYIYRIRK